MAEKKRPQLVFVDGTFEELTQELADELQIGEEVAADLAAGKKDEAMGKVVKASSALNSWPEKDIQPAYNLLIHLVINETQSAKKFLPQMCNNLQKPITSSPVHGPHLALGAFQSMFNLLSPHDSIRYNVFGQIVRCVKTYGLYDSFKGCLKNLPRWLEEWESDEEDQRKLYVDIADVAAEAGEDEESYDWILKACRTFETEDDEDAIKSDEAQQLSLRALRQALLSPTTFLFMNLRDLATVQSLSDTHPVYSQLLDIFAEQDLEDYNEFNEEHDDWIENQKLDHGKLQRKMRLLTFASLAASTQNREIEYSAIAKALQIPSEEVEMWAIDVIRAGLVEGKLSQQRKVFLVHVTTYRVFGEKQWRELHTRLTQYRNNLQDVLNTVRKSQAEAESQKEREVQELERKMQNAGLGESSLYSSQRRDRRGGQHQRNDRHDRSERNDNDD